VCTSCGHSSGKWHGKCASCGELNTVVEFREGRGGSRSPRAAAASSSSSWIAPGGAALRLVALSDVPAGGAARTRVGSQELDRVFGGGLTRGSCTLLCGAPGVGKSTLVLQLATMLCGATRGDGSAYAAFFSRQTVGGAAAAPAAAPARGAVSGQRTTMKRSAGAAPFVCEPHVRCVCVGLAGEERDVLETVGATTKRSTNTATHSSRDKQGTPC
jgi:DNA repair protein RadA/Sms